MLKKGSVVENPVLGLRAVITQTDVETDGRGYAVGWFIKPHRGLDPKHIHMLWDETYEVVAGMSHYQINGVPGVAQAGETVHIPPKTPHINPWNAGDQELQMRQTILFADSNPERVQTLLGAFATLHGLARDGKVGKNGAPNLLQFAVIFRTLLVYGNYFADMPVAAQSALFTLLASLGRRAGYQAIYPRYLEP